MRPVFAEAKTAGTIAEAVMRDALTRSLGVEWGPVRNGIAELAGVPTKVCEHFSQRHAEIVEEATARGYASARGIDVIQRETRDRKRVVSRDRAAGEWRARAAEHGFGARELAALIGRSRGADCRAAAGRARRLSIEDARAGRTHSAQRPLHPSRGDPGARRGSSRRGGRRASSRPWPTTSSRPRACRSSPLASSRIVDTRRRSSRRPTCSAARSACSRRPRASIRTAGSSPLRMRSSERSTPGRRSAQTRPPRCVTSARAMPGCASWRRGRGPARPSPSRRCARPTRARTSR